MMFVSYNSYTMGVTCRAATVNPTGTFSSSPGFSGVRVARSLVFCVMFCRSWFVLLSFFFSPSLFDLRFMISGTLIDSCNNGFTSFSATFKLHC